MSRAPRKTVIAPWRFYLVVIALLALPTLLVGRVLSLQVLDTDRGRSFLQNQGDLRSVRNAEIPAYRGVISDRRGEPLAVSTPVISLWTDPAILAGVEDLSALAGALETTPSALRERLDNYAGKRFIYLQRHLVPVAARDILALRIPGVYGKREYRRFYPAGEVVGQLVGFTNTDGAGITGLELAYDEWLKGVPGQKQYIKDLHGDAVRDIGVLEPARPGKDLRLSIDLRLQYLHHQELQRAMALTGASAGTIVTLDSHTGEVLAMVNHPVYNPNSRRGITPAQTRNRAMTDMYEPGSTMKAFTLVAALESGRYSTETLIDTSPGRIRVGRKVFPDPRDYGEITVSRIIEKSSQVGVTRIALDLGHQPILDVFARFGIGSMLATGFPGESAGLLPNRERWSDVEKATLAFGYGLTATPLQLAHAYSAFANDGILQPVSLLATGQPGTDGTRIISGDLAAQVLTVLQRVTEEHGTARKAQVPGYHVGGKTGTVHKVGPGGYQDNKYIALFAGIAPIEDPRFVTVVIINEPQGEAYGGGAAAAPVFSRVAQGTLRLLNVPPEVPAPAELTVAAPASHTSGAIPRAEVSG
ncbi:cell division protein [Kineobactrum sediminis]|uniref:Peptidoglycan D,D-transpeptidase FtsI n=1 Tax=Kineobactrum sediminis TaxID=1905677 RepID=A0A2N5Y3G5_9GAMM|nr:penicillin-binding transpeptidase domain-containing protein [Kineobactrum sediminis]PLW82934.1 cell division protein [Kineobactrum sediminis]